VISSAGTDSAPAASPEVPRDLVRMSVALRQSPVVAAARGPAGTSPGSDFHERTR
jgi:hypothetical protein